MEPEISFIIINYNTFDLTCKCIGSIKTKVQEVRYEIILVDNASEEMTPDSFLDKFPDINLIKSDVNLGFAKGNNLGISHSQGEFICLINSDAEILEGDFKKGISKLDKTDCSFLTGELIYPDGRIQHNCQSFPSFLKRLAEHTRIHKLFTKSFRSKYLQGFYFDYSKEGRPDWIWGTFMLFKKNLLSVFEDKKLPEDFFMYGEDMLWCYTAIQTGKYPFYSPSFVILHHLGRSNGNSEEMIQTNEQIFIKKNYNPIHRFVLKIIS